MAEPKMTTRALLDALRNHYIAPGEPAAGGVFVHEVGENGAYGNSSRCDALYAGFTSASGRILVGHELKVSRADWRHELEQADKADFWADQCHAWMIVAPSEAIVPKEEVPHGWGLMVPNPRAKRSFTTVLRPTIHADRNPSWSAMRSMMARADTLRQSEVHDLVNAGVAKRVKASEERMAKLEGAGASEQELRRLKDLVRNLERHLGIELGSDVRDYRAPDPELLGLALALARDVRKAQWAESTASNTQEQLRETADQLKTSVEKLRGLRAGFGKEESDEVREQRANRRDSK